MTKSETLRQLATSSNEKHIGELAQKIESLHRSKIESADQLAQILEPIAQAMAKLTDDTCTTLIQIEQKAGEQEARIEKALASAARAIEQTVTTADHSAALLAQAGRHLAWTHYAMALASGLMSAVLVSVFWLWVAPPTVANHLDAAEVADYLRPAIEALKPSRRN